MRIRSIKPEFWRSEAITRLSREHRLLFIGLWSYVDDNGVGIDDYRQVAADLFPLEDDPTEIRSYVREGLATLSREGRITRYQVAGKPYLHITGWTEHQRIDKPGKKRFPGPDHDDATLTSENEHPRESVARMSRECRETPLPGEGEQGNRGTGERRSSNGGTSRAAERGKNRLDDVIATAHTPAAHKFVTAYATQCTTRPPADVLAKLGPKVDQLIAAGYTDTQITQSLVAWGRKGIGTHLLTEIAHELVNSDRGRHLRPVEDIPDEELTREFLERELGPDYERITAPREIEFGDPAARQAWYRDASRKRLEERRAEYRRRASRAQNRTPA